jgi:site-specific DNA-methyltransferase (adenine-specific)
MEPTQIHHDEHATLWHGDCIETMRLMPDNSIDSVVTDPPYGLEFMGAEWDGADGFRRSMNAADVGRDDVFGRQSAKAPEYRAGKVFQDWCELWAREAFRVLKPGGHLLAFGGTRTFHRLAAGIEDAGFEIRDSIAWLYGSGFPKSMDVSKAIDKAARGVPQGGADPTSANHGNYRTSKTEGKRWNGDSGQSYGAGGSAFLTDSATERAETEGAETAPEAREWEGWGTALKPAFEPVVVARKPLGEKTVAANVLAHGTGALNIDASRIGHANLREMRGRSGRAEIPGGNTVAYRAHNPTEKIWEPSEAGRWPANVILDESQAEALDEQSGTTVGKKTVTKRSPDGAGRTAFGAFAGQSSVEMGYDDEGGASRFFYTAKAPQHERPKDAEGVGHPTVKPVSLMRWLVKLVTPPGGTVLEPFAGSGTTIEAALTEGFHVIAIEREAKYIPLCEARMARPMQGELF